MRNFIIASALFLAAVTSAVAGEFEDCLLNGLKGVSSDAAARMIRQACETKRAERAQADQQRREAALDAEHGARLNAELAASWAAKGVVSVRNDTQLTITYVELAPKEGGSCPERRWVYQTQARPQSTFQLKASMPSECLGSVTALRARPERMLDRSVRPFSPMPEGELLNLNRALGTTYGEVVIPPKPAPKAAPPAVSALPDRSYFERAAAEALKAR